MTVKVEQTVRLDVPDSSDRSIHRVIEITDDMAKGEKGRSALLKSAMTALKTMAKVEDGGPLNIELRSEDVSKLKMPLGQRQHEGSDIRNNTCNEQSCWCYQESKR